MHGLLCSFPYSPHEPVIIAKQKVKNKRPQALARQVRWVVSAAENRESSWTLGSTEKNLNSFIHLMSTC